MSTLDEVYDLESQKENFEIVDDYSQNDQLVVKLNYQYGILKITIPDEFPEKTPIFEPCFKPVFDDAYIRFCLNDFCNNGQTGTEQNLDAIINYFEKDLLLELVAETPAERLRPRRLSRESQDSTDLSETEDSDNKDSGNEDQSEQYMPPSEKPEYQKRTDRHTGQRAKERKHKWNGFFIQKEGLDEVWKTKRIEFQGDLNWIRHRYGYLESEIVMTRSENVQKRYGGQMDKLGGVQFRRENSKNDFDFIVRVHTDSTRQNEKSKQCQNQFRDYRRNTDSCHIYLLHYRADDAIFSNKTGFDQLVSEMDKADVVKMERQLAQRKHDRKKFFRVHKKSDLIRSDLAHG